MTCLLRHTMLLILVIAMSAEARTVSAQQADDDPWYRRFFTPVPAHDEVFGMLDEMPDLTDDQRTVVMALYESFLEEFQSKSAAFREEWTTAMARNARNRDGRDRFAEQPPWARGPSDYDATVQLEWRAVRPRLERQLTDDVAAVLEPEQRDAWESAVRRLRREHWFESEQSLHPGGSAADLRPILESLTLSDRHRDAIASLIETYEIDLDQIIERIAVEGSAMSREGERLRREDPNREKPETREAVARMSTFYTETRYAIAKLSILARDQIANLLEEPQRTQFLEASGAELWPHIYQKGAAEVAIELIREHEPAGSPRRASVDSIEAAYRSQRKPYLDRMEQRAREWTFNPDSEERKAIGEGSRLFWERARANPGEFHMLEPPYIEETRACLLIESRMVARLRGLYSPQERGALPAALRLALAFDVSE